MTRSKGTHSRNGLRACVCIPLKRGAFEGSTFSSLFCPGAVESVPAPYRYRNLGAARRAQPTQAPHSTGSDRPQPQHEAPRPPNGPNPLKKDHFFCARGMNQRVGRGRQFVQYCILCTGMTELTAHFHSPVLGGTNDAVIRGEARSARIVGPISANFLLRTRLMFRSKCYGGNPFWKRPMGRRCFRVKNFVTMSLL